MADRDTNKKKMMMVEFDKAIAEITKGSKPAIKEQMVTILNDPAKKREFEAQLKKVFMEIIAIPAYSLPAAKFATFKSRFNLREDKGRLLDRTGKEVANFSVTGKTAFGTVSTTNIVFT